MESLADQIARMAGVEAEAAPDTSPPNPDVRTCPFCLERRKFRPDWTCSGCGEKAIFFYDVFTCEDCGTKRERQYTRNRLRYDHCECGLTEEERERRRRVRQKLNAPPQDVMDARSAQRCWMEVYDQQCDLDPLPHHYCYACTRNGGRYQAKRRAYERDQAAATKPGIEFEEIPL